MAKVRWANQRPGQGWWPVTWRVLLVLTVLSPLAIAPAPAWVPGLCAAVAVAVAVARWPVRGVPVERAAAGVLALSVVVSVGYWGTHQLAAAWLPFEAAALWLLLWRVILRAPLRAAAWVGVPLALAATLLPLRISLRIPQAGVEVDVFLVLLAAVPVGCVAGAAVYLRLLHRRRERAVATARRDLRLEMARALHDFVAHEVTGIVLEVQAAQVAGYGPEESGEMLARVEQSGLRALDSMDQTVAVLRDPEASGGDARTVAPRLYGVGDLAELVDRFGASFGSPGSARVRLDLADGVVDLLPREADNAAYVAVLEALTNVRRHAAGASRVVVRVERARVGVELTVTDDGGGGAGGASTGGALRRRADAGGTGLAELAERVGMLGGRLDSGAYGGGWRVRAYLPTGVGVGVRSGPAGG